MPIKLKINLFGTPSVFLQKKTITDFRSSKAQALLYYLAMTGRVHTRSTLAGLLWGDFPETQARVNLSKTLSNLRQLVGEHLEITRQTIAFASEGGYQLDVEEFTAATEPTTPPDLTRLASAVALYQGEFLEGFYVRDAPEFEQWMLTERVRLSERILQTLLTLADGYAAQADFQEAILHTQRILALEPWREEAHQRMMLLLARNGQRGAALTHFKHCCEILDKELGVEPDDATVDLMERIRDGEFETSSDDLVTTVPAQPPVVAQSLPPTPTPHYNVPTPLTPFVGRQEALKTVTQHLLNPDCRLLTLVGPGGIGKTRLAVQSARALFEQEPAAFNHGILYVALESVVEPHGLWTAIAQAANFSFYEDVPHHEQLLNYLQEKQILLILDNLEHLPAATSLISEILTTAVETKILATSREMLDVQGAWSYPVTGLCYPKLSSDDLLNYGEYAAVNLFIQCAQRVGGTLATSVTTGQAGPAIAQICRLVDGMPLGIELAASWLRIMPADEIAQELAQNLDILTTRHQHVPERHRNMRAVLENSWQLLEPKEQEVVAALAIFPSHFDRSAAKAVANASLLMLATLAEKSLLKVEEDGSYRLHPLLRQFLREQLERNEDEFLQAQSRHSAYYLTFLKARTQRLASHEQQATLEEIEQALDNIHLGWRFALAQNQLESLAKAARALYRFHRIRCRYQEGRALFGMILDEAALQAEDGTEPLITQTQCLASIYQGAFDFYLGDYEQANTMLQQGLALARQTQQQQEAARAHSFLGQIAGWVGDKEVARRELKAGLNLYRAVDDKNGMADVLHKLAQIDGSFGDYLTQKEVAEECLTIGRALGRPDWIASALDVLGWAMLCLGEYNSAEAYYRESLTCSQEIGNQLGQALALGGIGSVAWAIGGPRLSQARDYFLQSLELCQEIGHRHHLSSRLWYLGQVANDMGEHELALQYGEEGLAIAQAIGSQIFAAYNLSCLGEAALGKGDLVTSRSQLLEVLRLALDAEHLPPLFIALIQFAHLRVAEINQSELDTAVSNLDADEHGSTQIQKANHEEPDKNLCSSAKISVQHSQPEITGLNEDEYIQQMAEVLTLLRLVSEHPASWQVFRERAEKLAQEIVENAPQVVEALSEPLWVDGKLEETVRGLLARSDADLGGVYLP